MASVGVCKSAPQAPASTYPKETGYRHTKPTPGARVLGKQTNEMRGSEMHANSMKDTRAFNGLSIAHQEFQHELQHATPEPPHHTTHSKGLIPQYPTVCSPLQFSCTHRGAGMGLTTTLLHGFESVWSVWPYQLLVDHGRCGTHTPLSSHQIIRRSLTL